MSSDPGLTETRRCRLYCRQILRVRFHPAEFQSRVRENPTIRKEKYFGKHGFKSKSAKSINPTNIEYLEANIHKLVSKEQASKENDFFSVNLEKLGFNKLLGTGKVTNKYKIKASYASKKAIEKIKSNGGEVILTIKKETKE